MTVCVLGANGQLGSDLLRAGSATFTGIQLLPLFRSDLDVRDPESVSKILSGLKFDALVNCTSYHKTDEVEKHASEAVAVNAHAPRSMAAVCKAKGAFFVHLSTDYVFGGHASRPYLETDAPAPLNVYGASKLLGEDLVFREYSERSLIVRVASLFGLAGASGKGGNFVETMLRLSKQNGEVRVVDDIRMSPTSTADAARTILALLDRQAVAGIYHVVNSGEATWFEFAREIFRQARVSAAAIPITSGEFPTPAARPAYSVLDNRKAASLAGPIPAWQDALRRYLHQKGHIQ